MRKTFRVMVSADPDGYYVAECLDLPGCVSQGRSKEEAVANIQDAILGYLQSLQKHNEPLPVPREHYDLELSIPA